MPGDIKKKKKLARQNICFHITSLSSKEGGANDLLYHAF